MNETRIFQAFASDLYEGVIPIDDAGLDLFMELDGTPISESWHPIEVQLISEDDDNGAQLLESDFPWFGSGALVLRRKAMETVGELLAQSGELLPLVCPTTDLWLFNVTTVIPGLDETHSLLTRFSSGEIMHIEKPEFEPSLVAGKVAFKVTVMRRLPIFYFCETR
jgi:hypothetical protein